jgi:hypothetical protein
MNNVMKYISLKKSAVKCTYMIEEKKENEIPYQIVDTLDLS